MEIAGQILSIISFFVAFLLYQMKTRKSTLIVQTVLVVVVAASYFFLGAYSGMALNIACILRSLVYYRTDIFRGKKWAVIMSVMLLVVGGVVAWIDWSVSGAWNLLVIAGLVINTYCLSLPNTQHFRASICITSPMVLVYDIFVFSLGGILMEAISILSAVIGLIRYSGKKPKAEQTE